MTSLDETRPAASDRSQRGGIRSGFAARLQTKQPRRQSWGIASIALCVSMAAIWLVAVPLAFAPPARAQSGTVLILSTSVNGGTSSPEAEAATADGYSVTVDTPSTWDSLTEANFASYSAIVIGDPSNGSCATGVPSDALSTAGTWGPAITGDVAVVGTAPEYAGASGTTLIDDGIAYAVSGSGTGLYISLNCEYSSASANTAVPLLAHVDGGGFTVQGQSATCPNSGTVNTLVAVANNQLAKLQASSLGPWASPACSVEESFDAWPSALSGLGLDAGATPADFTASDGVTGQPYLLVGIAAERRDPGTVPLDGRRGAPQQHLRRRESRRARLLAKPRPRSRSGRPRHRATSPSRTRTSRSRPTAPRSISPAPTTPSSPSRRPQPARPGPSATARRTAGRARSASAAPAAGDIYTIAGLRTADGQGGSPTNCAHDP